MLFPNVNLGDIRVYHWPFLTQVEVMLGTLSSHFKLLFF